MHLKSQFQSTSGALCYWIILCDLATSNLWMEMALFGVYDRSFIEPFKASIQLIRCCQTHLKDHSE